MKYLLAVSITLFHNKFINYSRAIPSLFPLIYTMRKYFKFVLCEHPFLRWPSTTESRTATQLNVTLYMYFRRRSSSFHFSTCIERSKDPRLMRSNRTINSRNYDWKNVKRIYSITYIHLTRNIAILSVNCSDIIFLTTRTNLKHNKNK